MHMIERDVHKARYVCTSSIFENLRSAPHLFCRSLKFFIKILNNKYWVFHFFRGFVISTRIIKYIKIFGKYKAIN